MTKEYLEKRIAEIQQAIDQSAGNHNTLLGRMAEDQHLLAQLFEEEVKAKQAAEGQENASS